MKCGPILRLGSRELQIHLSFFAGKRSYLDVMASYTRRAVAMSSTAMPTDLKTVVAER